MSGYRTLHREQVIVDDRDVSGAAPGSVWSLATSPLLTTKNHGGPTTPSSTSTPKSKFRLYVAGSLESDVLAYIVEETSLDLKADLDASAARLTLTHRLTDQQRRRITKPPPSTDSTTSTATESSAKEDAAVSPPAVTSSRLSLGCSRVCVTRNYVGQDTSAGSVVVVSLDLVGKLRVWELDANIDDNDTDIDSNALKSSSQPIAFQARHETVLCDATGSTLALPRPTSEGPLSVAIGCLDGTVLLVSTGLVTPKYADKTIPEIGTVLQTWGSKGSAIPLSLGWKPNDHGSSAYSQLAVGRQDGVVDLFSTVTNSNSGSGNNNNTNPRQQHHRLLQHSTPVRALSYTPDGNLLITASDQGLVCIWDTSRQAYNSRSMHSNSVALVHHILLSNSSWITSVTPLADSCRFVISTLDGKLQVWDMEHPNQVTHTFTTDHPVHACVALESGQRLVAGNDAGWVQLYSVE